MANRQLSNAFVYSGLVLLVLGLAHIPVWLVDGSGWEGPISWRKPILFGVSTGLTLLSLGWILQHLKADRRNHWIAAITSMALVLEVGLITLQSWRGTASHFNRQTTLDATIDLSMLLLIVIAFVGIVYFAVLLVRSSGESMEPDYACAAYSGMVFLIVSCVIGFVISIFGYSQIGNGADPATFGANGAVKFPHGITIHALQILPATVYLLAKMGVSSRLRIRCVCWLSISFAMQIVFASYQTLNGLGRFELADKTSVIFLAFAVLPAIFALAGLRFPLAVSGKMGIRPN